MIAPRLRVIVDNDFSGDPDDLYQLAHHVLSPSVRIPFVVGSHLPVGDLFDPSERQAENAAAVAQELLGILESPIPVLQGSNRALEDRRSPVESPAARAIVEEAMRDDTDLPLVVAVGGGLTELASAYLLEPRIAERMTAIWIGGPEYAGHPLPVRPGKPTIEYNLGIDLAAAQTVFNDSPITIWQVPRNVYRQCLVSLAEIDARVRPLGELGAYLAGALDRVVGDSRRDLGETFALGDSPLVLLTALRSAFEPDASSSVSVVVPTPAIAADGGYEGPPAIERPARVFQLLDTRLMFEDMYAKFSRFHAEHS